MFMRLEIGRLSAIRISPRKLDNRGLTSVKTNVVA